MTVQLLPSASRDFSDAYSWYKANARRGTARNFENAVNQSLQKLPWRIALYECTFRDFRECPIEGFPYLLVAREFEGVITVVRIFHTSRDPSDWQQYVAE